MNKSMILFLLIIATACGKNHNTDHDGVWKSISLYSNITIKIKNDTAYILNPRGLAMIKLNIDGHNITYKDSIGEWHGEFGYDKLNRRRILNHSKFKMNLSKVDTIQDEHIKVVGGNNYIQINTKTLKVPEILIVKYYYKNNRSLISEVSNNGSFKFYIIDTFNNIEYQGYTKIRKEYSELLNVEINNYFAVPFNENKKNDVSDGNYSEYIIIKNDSIKHYTDICEQNYDFHAIDHIIYNLFNQTTMLKIKNQKLKNMFQNKFFKDTTYKK